MSGNKRIRGKLSLGQILNIPWTYIIAFTILFIPLTCYFSYIYGLDFNVSYYSSLLATFWGILLAVYIAVSTDRYRESLVEKERKMKVLELLKKELLFNLDVVYMQEDEGLNEDDIGKIIYYAADIKDETYRTLSDSGEIVWIKDLELLDKISHAYFEIRGIRYLANLYLELYRLPRKNIPEKSLFDRVERRFANPSELLLSPLHDAVDAIDIHLKKKS